MIEKTIVIKADTQDAVKGIDDVAQSSDELTKSVDKTNKSIKETGDKSKKAATSASKGFKAMGTALKALGIGIVVAAVAGLAAALSKNQKFMDAFNSVTGAIGIVLSEVSNVLVDVYQSVSKSSENFDALGKVMSGLLTLALTPLKVSFFGIKLAIQEAQLIWEKSFFGGKDAKTIAELNVGILETKTALLDVATGALDAGKDIVTNFGEAITESITIGSDVVDGLSKISVKAALDTAKANVQLENSARLAAAQQGRLVEQFDRSAELQRQARDNESKSIAERTAANDELLNVLNKQEKAMLSQAELQIADAVAKDKVNSTIETQVALTEALANKEAVLAQITGFKSEQDVNRIALLKEENELNLTVSDSEKARRLAQLEFEKEQATDPLEKLQIEQERLDLENQQIIDDLEYKKTLYAEGTQARIDAEQDYENRKQEVGNSITANDKATEKQITANKKIEDDKKIALDEQVKDAKVAIANNTLSLIQEVAGKGTKLAKIAAVAQATMSGIKGVQNAYTTAQESPITAAFPAYPLIQAGLAGAFSALQIKKILSTSETSVGGAGGAGGAGGGGGAPSAPSFNLVEGSGSNQIAQGLQASDSPVQAYVVSGNVSSAQSLDRNIIENSEI